jgi:hypothetical protein
MNAPWGFFDLSELRLYAGDADGLLAALTEGLTYCDSDWQPETHLKSLSLLKAGGVLLPGLDAGLAMLEHGVTELTKGLKARSSE